MTYLATAGIPIGYTFGRLGNFINGELFGRVTTSPIGMIFPLAEPFSSYEPWVRDVADKVGIEYQMGQLINLPRHPSQLYEALFEGIILFLILWFIVRPWKIRKNLPHGTVFSFYLMGYGIFRFFIEYCRQPDASIGYVISLGRGSRNIALFESFLNISEGQVFCLLMVAAGAILLGILSARRHYDSAASGKAKGHSQRKRH